MFYVFTGSWLLTGLVVKMFNSLTIERFCGPSLTMLYSAYVGMLGRDSVSVMYWLIYGWTVSLNLVHWVSVNIIVVS